MERDLVTAIDWSKTEFSSIPSNQRKYFEREIYAIVSIEKSKLPLLRQKFPKLKHIKDLKRDTEKRDYLRKFAEKFDNSIFEVVDYSTNLDKLLAEYEELIKNRSQLVIIDDNIFYKFKQAFSDVAMIKERKVRDFDLKRLALITDNLANLFRRIRDLFRNSTRRIEIIKKILKR